MNPNILSHIISSSNNNLKNKERLYLSRLNKKYKKHIHVKKIESYVGDKFCDDHLNYFPYLERLVTINNNLTFSGIRLENLTFLRLPYDTKMDIDLLSSFPNLLTLYLSKDNVKDDIFFDKDGNFRCPPKLNSLILFDTKITNKPFRYLSSLTSLALYDDVSVDNNIFEYLPNLEKLDLYDSITDDWFPKLPNPHKLKYLNIPHNRNLTDEIFQYLPCLIELNLYNNMRITNVGLRGLSSLTKLNLSLSHIITDEAFADKSLSNLTHLDLSHIPYTTISGNTITNKTFLDGNLPRLRTLLINSNENITDEAFANKSLSSLTKLDISNTPRVTGAIFSELPNLESLTLQNNEIIKDDDLFDSDGNFILTSLRNIDIRGQRSLSRDIFPDYVEVCY